ncbi:hypothetical protein CDD80_3516 [Ophiocordyceps camponoti-rufipedis]|uniref:Uncharacterized protein n=1 Tax=Ophiocordyceps camponoti-rufipedis TaxID=2004952 RepID=A0A2C5Y738_9HYPO|nr:hypothetical protein CDD80_3516 [Ophiocordyceps camponoti-rufipedis]
MLERRRDARQPDPFPFRRSLPSRGWHGCRPLLRPARALAVSCLPTARTHMAFSTGAFRSGGAHHGLFRPPVSSSACLPAPRPAFEAATPKRRRNDHSKSPSRRPRNLVVELDADHEPPTTPAPFSRQRTYTLAGHLDTPYSGPDDGSSLLDESMYSDSNYRRALGSKRPRDDVDAADPSRPMPLFHLPAEPVSSRTWSALALDTIGGVVGRVWDFCTAGAFRGFYAGEGEGYDLNLPDDESGSSAEKRVPGHYPQPQPGCYLSMAADCDTSPSEPAVKRRQTALTEDLGRNWVMVHEPREDGPRRRTSYQRARARGTGTGRRGTPADRRLGTRLHTSASSPWSATPERSFLGASTAPSRSPSPIKLAASRTARPTSASADTAGVALPANSASASIAGCGRRRTLLPAPSTGTSHRRSHSNASTASSRAADEVEASPRLNAEAKKLAARLKMDERDADVKIEAFNKQLQAMIRQGREALGTTIEVEGGWEDDD